MAIGAGRGDVRRLVLTQGLWLGLTGGAVGTLLGAPVFLALSAAMTGLGPLTPWTLLAVPVGLVLVALAACWVPSRRATGIDPTIALRIE
jgi:ABC-type antimicrobial peptide transport system permease subunit